MKRISILFIIAFISSQLLAQENPEKFKETIYSFVPQYMFVKGIRLDVERQIAGKHWLQICPQFYLSNQDSDDDFDTDEFNNLLGFGINVYHKIFVNWDERQKGGWYFSYGLTYNYYDIEYDDYYLGNPIDARGYINKYGGDLILGHQFLIKKKVSIDLYGGMGTRYSDISTNDDSDHVFDDTYVGYNYTGNLLLLGFRIGVVF